MDAKAEGETWRPRVIRRPDANPYPTLCTYSSGEEFESSKRREEICSRVLGAMAEAVRLRRREASVVDLPRGLSRSLEGLQC